MGVDKITFAGYRKKLGDFESIEQISNMCVLLTELIE
jgi:hypothetical protein